MISFSRQSKIEILKNNFCDDDTCAIAFLAGLFHSCGEIERKNGKTYFKIVSELEELFPFICSLLAKFFGYSLMPEKSENFNVNKNEYFQVSFEIDKFKNLLLDIGVIEFGENGIAFNFSINKNLLCEDECKRAFVKGVYIGASTSSIKISTNPAESCGSGYHLEFVSRSKSFLEEFSEILAEYSIVGKIFERKNAFVLYIKDVNTIQDLLALVGANNSVLEIANEMATRQLRNKVNRQVNCINANINKTVEASLKQVEAINKIINTIGLDCLADDLQEVAVLRLANQEESLDELLQLSNIKLTRSGLNHRFRKLIKIAESLEEI